MPGADERGPDFFEHGVMEDPQSSILFDPEFEVTRSQQTPTSADRLVDRTATQLVHFEEEQQQPASRPPTLNDLQGPRGPVDTYAVPGTDVMILRALNQADADVVRQIIERIAEFAKDAEVQIELVPLEYGDATAVTNALTQLFQRVTVGPGGNVRNTSTTTTPSFGGGAAPGVAGGFAAAPTAASTASQQATSSVFLEAIPRFNAILVAAPRIRFDDVKKEIKRLDKPNPPVGRMVAFHLMQAPSARVATFLTNLYATRFPSEAAVQDQVRFQHDDSSNTLFVQASPADLQDIAELIKVQDTAVSSAVNEVRIVSLKNSTSDEIASLLSTAIIQGTTTPTTTPTTPTAAPGLPGAARPPGTPIPGVGIPGIGTPGVPGAASTTGTTAAGGPSTKSMTLRLYSGRPGTAGTPESGLLEDIHITSYARINSLIIEAPSKSMGLVLGMIRELDVPPTARAEMKVFTLLHADAQSMSLMLQQLFLGTTGTTTTPGGAGGFAGGAGGGGFAGAGGGLAGTTTVTPAVQNPAGARQYPPANITLGGYTPEGAPIIPLSISTDVRTNSIVVAGARNDLDAVFAIVTRLDEDTSIQERHTECYHLRNASAADVATALQSMLTQQLQQLSIAQQLPAYTEYQRGVVVVAEPVSNNLLISVSKDYFPIVMRLISDLDAQPPQVVIQVLVAEVDLTSTEEFGVEVGLQSPILFTRSVIPAPGATGSVTYTNPGGTGSGLTPIGVTTTGSNYATANPGQNFNNANFFANPLGIGNPLASPGTVGFQGLNNLGVGRSDSNGLGGFVFSAASNSFNLLIRALKTQGRLDILSRPQIQALDGQTALINVGSDVPYLGSTVVNVGVSQQSINYRPVGVILQVTPRISPDGTVIMRVIPEVSSVSPTPQPLGNGLSAVAFNVQHVETTVLAQDGETVALGGIIVRNDQKNENKIPWLGDLPGIGALFRYRTQSRNRQELLVIMTPHIVRTRQEADRILAEEARKMEWCIGDIIKTQGPRDLEPIMPPVKGTAGNGHAGMSVPGAATILVPPSSTVPGPSIQPPVIETPQAPRETLPEPRKQPVGQEKPTNQGAMAAPEQPPAVAATQGAIQQTSANQATDGQSATPPTEEKHKWYWSLFHRDQ